MTVVLGIVAGLLSQLRAVYLELPPGVRVAVPRADFLLANLDTIGGVWPSALAVIVGAVLGLAVGLRRGRPRATSDPGATATD